MRKLVAVLLLACSTTACGPSARPGDSAAAAGRAADTVGAPRPGTSPSAPPSAGGESLVVATDGISVSVDGGLWVLWVPFTYVNRRATAVANPGCNPPTSPMVEWWDGTAWTPAYLYGSAACRSRPYVIAAGARYASTLDLRLPRDSTNPAGAPTAEIWRAPLDAWFRLSWRLVEPGRDAERMDEGPALPERERTSAAFRLPRVGGRAGGR